MHDDVIRYFLELVAIDSESRDERAVTDRLKADLAELGADILEDDANTFTGGNAGNLHALIPGRADQKPILFCAHADTVKPGLGVKASITEGRIHTDGTTVLGGDDKSGLAEIIMGIRDVVESGEPHAPIEVLVTVSEEIGLLGAKHFDKSKLRSAFGYALDAHRVGDLVVGAPAQNSIRMVITGKEAHAGVEPEKGINAIRVAAEAIAAMPLGRIDHETTCNVGIISGGSATNIVPNRVELKGEARSHNPRKLEQVTADIRHAAESAVQRHNYDFGAAALEWESKQEYAAFRVGDGEAVVQLALDALNDLGIKAEVTVGGGGSDANIINAAGLPMIICGTGMNKVHTVAEDIEAEELKRGAAFIAALIRRHAQR
ncbi:MAG: M20/M25/M40 family metallo-hydrolase [Candidatus Cloacimonetes bacterium]|jgi:tripeptide aminopeptidase|nr:M20/M25/M40 family metallo-hydrolase [Candidatus Cloacimonadota bacterium]MDY0366857.1 M20/M25/M40 family metallo-hydrolase [Candidatus Syntrophosphaera sp.]